MSTRVAVNGFGRIGRLVFRHLMKDADGDLEVVALNDIAALDNLAYLLRHDSVHGGPDASIAAANGELRWDDRAVAFSGERDPADLPWREMEVDLVIEASGAFTRRNDAARHLEAGAEVVIVTAPGEGADLTVCVGVNENRFDPTEHRVISSASCTTNCLAPVAMVLDEKFGIESGILNTVHAYTSSQGIVDGPSKKWRRGRAAAVSIVPTTTGAAIATTQVLPELEGKLDGMAMRVPVSNGSICDVVIQSEQPGTIESVNAAFREAAKSERLEGILGVSDEQLVSADIVGDTHSALVDARSTMVVRDHTIRVLAWYDNEWGYARRVFELARHVGLHTSSNVRFPA